MKNYLIFDFGASSGRALVAKFDGNKFIIEEIHRFDNNPVYATGTLYWDILRLLFELKTGIQISFNKFKNISSIGIDTWGLDFGFIDKNGKLIANPVHYRDKGRNNITKKLYEIIPEKELFNLTGMFVHQITSIFHMYYLKESKRVEFLNAYKFLMMPDIFNYFLTGEITNEFTNATGTLMYNQKEKRWEKKILRKLDVPEKIFPVCLMSGTKIGMIQNSISKELDIPRIPVIAPATHDTASAVAGIPVTKKNKNFAFISIGTWCIIGIETHELIINDEVFKSGYGNEGSVEGKSFLAKNLTGLWIIQQCREKWIKDKVHNISWTEIVSKALAEKPFKAFIDVDNPVFGQVQIDMPKVISEYCKSRGQKSPIGIGEISRCIYESLVLKFRYNIEILERITKKRIELLHLIGGGTKNSFLCQLTADITGIPVIAGPAEATAIGNLIMQLKGTGEINTLEQGREIALKSSKIIHYEPKNKSMYGQIYNRYQKDVLKEIK